MKKAEHEVVEVLIAAACAVRSGADTCVEIDAWANGAVVAIDGRTSRRSRKPNGSWGQRATAMKSNGKTAIPVRLATLALEGSGDQTIPQHGRAENSLPRRMDVAFGDDQRRVLTECTAHNLAVLRQVVLNLLRIALVRCKAALKIKRLVATPADHFRAELLGLL